MAIFRVGDQFAGKSLKDVANQVGRSGGYIPRIDVLASQLGLAENTPLTANQRLNFGGDTGSGEFQFLSSQFTPEEQFQQAQQQSMMDQARAREGEFIGRVQEIPNALKAIEQEIGLPQAREAYRSSAGGVMDVQNRIRDVAPAQQALANRFGISAPRLAARTAAKKSELAPELETATRGAENANLALQGILGDYQTKAQNVFTPLQMEAGILGDSISRDFDLLKTNIQSSLQRELAELSNMNAIQLQEMANSGALDRIEKQAQAEKVLMEGSWQGIDLGNRYALVDSQGNEIGSFAKGKLGGTGTGSNISPYLSGSSAQVIPSGSGLQSLWNSSGGGFSNVEPSALQYMNFN